MRYKFHKYTWTKPYTCIKHDWSLIGPDGGIHFHATEPYQSGEEYTCGLEIHYAPKQGDNAPSQIKCWLLNAPCWHDGTTLFAEETMWPKIRPCLEAGNHEAIFRYLEDEADKIFKYEKERD